MLTLPVLCISESCIEVKTSIFIFTFLCGASKGFTKAFKASFEAPQSSVTFKLIVSFCPGLKGYTPGDYHHQIPRLLRALFQESMNSEKPFNDQ